MAGSAVVSGVVADPGGRACAVRWGWPAIVAAGVGAVVVAGSAVVSGVVADLGGGASAARRGWRARVAACAGAASVNAAVLGILATRGS
jgi:hypothetical protein